MCTNVKDSDGIMYVGGITHLFLILANACIVLNLILQVQADPNQWNGGGYYGYAQGYENYGYAPAATGGGGGAQDPNMYGGYQGYANYQAPQQQQQMGYS